MIAKRVWGALLVLGFITITLASAMDTIEVEEVEVADVVWEKIPEDEFRITTKYGEVTRTHDVKVIEFTYAEAKLMLQVAQAEAGNQGEDGMWLVMSVIENRRRTDGDMFHPLDDHSVEGTIYKKYSFSSIWDGRYMEVEISPECHLALARIERGEVCPSIIGFERINSEKLDKYFSAAFEYRDHRFYTLK